MKPSLLIRLVASLVFAFSIVVGGCSASTKNSPPGAIADDFGQMVQITAIPQRIVSLAPSATEILFDLGLGDKVVGVDSYSDYPDAAKKVEKVGGFSDTDIEKVVSLRPDLVVAADIHKARVAPALRKAGLTVIGLDATSLEGVMADVRLMGKATGTTDAAEKLAGDLEKRMQAVAKKMSPLPDSQRPRVLVLVWQDPIWTAGGDTLQNDLVVKAGGVNIASSKTGQVEIPLETVVAADPQVIMAFAGVGMGDTIDWAKTEPRLANIAARKSNPPRVYPAADPYLRPAPRVVDALEELAKLLHPELY